ncbi:MAG: GHMP kinase [Saprospiraceae bacterium]|nr:GHMP kinase [Saprospiraceae bacterium]
MPPKHSFRANGKVLLTGEYLVLDGALALGIPLSVGQRMQVSEGSGSEIVWESLRPNGEQWFTGRFDLFGFDPIKTSDEAVALRLKEIFESAVRLNSDFLSKWKKYRVRTEMDFEPEWGLGSSSTLITCIAAWADVDPYDLLETTFGGSGYDIACAMSDHPVLYQSDDLAIDVQDAAFSPRFSDNLYFVYLGQKRDTRLAAREYAEKKVSSKDINEVSTISRSICTANNLSEFDSLLKAHEELIGTVLGKKPVKQDLFDNYWGEVKSLGAWGGDFVLATSSKSATETEAYFKNKGYHTFFPYKQLALCKAGVNEQA